MKHFISIDQMTKEDIFTILETAAEYQKNPIKLEKQVFAANLFLEPSTRTKMSFVVAERKLGIENLDFQAENSSVLKGESLYDTAKTFEAIGANILVIRDKADYWYKELQDKINIPIINAGAGAKEHPTQAMLDLQTIYQEFGKFEGLKVAIVGDIKHSRVAGSNAKALKKLGAEVYFSAPEGFELEDSEFRNIPIDEAVEMCDVVMLLRIQHERHEYSVGTYQYLDHFGLTKERESRMKEHAIIMHPAPINRGVEIDSDLVECEKSRIFKQMENGVYVRMAIITNLLKEWGTIDEDCNQKYPAVI